MLFEVKSKFKTQNITGIIQFQFKTQKVVRSQFDTLRVDLTQFKRQQVTKKREPFVLEIDF